MCAFFFLSQEIVSTKSSKFLSTLFALLFCPAIQLARASRMSPANWNRLASKTIRWLSPDGACMCLFESEIKVWCSAMGQIGVTIQIKAKILYFSTHFIHRLLRLWWIFMSWSNQMSVADRNMRRNQQKKTQTLNECGYFHELVYNLQINYNFMIYIWNSWNGVERRKRQ